MLAHNEIICRTVCFFHIGNKDIHIYIYIHIYTTGASEKSHWNLAKNTTIYAWIVGWMVIGELN